MIKSSIKLVVLPLFIAILLTSFYVMQPRNADAATKRYKNSGSQSDTPLASDRFDDVAKGYVPASRAIHEQNVIKTPSTVSDSKIALILEQYVDCERDPSKGTCKDIFLSGKQNVILSASSTSPSNLDAKFKLNMIQKDDTENQDNVRNSITGDQRVTATTASNGKFSSNAGVDLNTYQYNKRGEISESLSDYKIDSLTDAIKSDSGSGNDDSFNINNAAQRYDVNAKQGAAINVANKGSTQAFTIGQFNADCDDTDLATGTTPDISCRNEANHRVTLDAQGSTIAGSNKLDFNTLSPIETQQVNTCQFSQNLNCLNDEALNVKATTTGTGVANIELENPNGKPIVFQQNDCNDLVRSPNIQQCSNRSFNYFDVQKTGTGSNIFKTNLDLQVVQKNDCDYATAPIDCVNRGLKSGITDVGGRNIQAEFSPGTNLNTYPNTIVTVNAKGDGSTIEDADPDSFLTMKNDCDGARPQSSTVLGSSNCINEALNEAHFLATAGTAVNTGATVDVDRIVGESTTTNNCANLDQNKCLNTAYNSFTAQAANAAVININSDVKQTNYLENSCNDAECNNNALNFMLLNADNQAIISASSSDLSQTNTLYNGCTTEANCNNKATNSFTVFAEKDGSDVDISKMIQTTDLSNTCSGSTTTCSNTAFNDYDIINTSGAPITSSTDQSIVMSNSFTSGSHSNDVFNTMTLTKSTGTSFSFSGSQSSTNNVADNSFATTPGASGSCQVTQSNGGTTQSGTC